MFMGDDDAGDINGGEMLMGELCIADKPAAYAAYNNS